MMGHKYCCSHNFSTLSRRKVVSGCLRDFGSTYSCPTMRRNATEKNLSVDHVLDIRRPLVTANIQKTVPRIAKCSKVKRTQYLFGVVEPTFVEQISILQGRIEELEGPRRTRSYVPLSRPSTSSALTPQISPTNTMGLGPLLTHFCMQFQFQSDFFKQDYQIYSKHPVTPSIQLQRPRCQLCVVS